MSSQKSNNKTPSKRAKTDATPKPPKATKTKKPGLTDDDLLRDEQAQYDHDLPALEAKREEALAKHLKKAKGSGSACPAYGVRVAEITTSTDSGAQIAGYHNMIQSRHLNYLFDRLKNYVKKLYLKKEVRIEQRFQTQSKLPVGSLL